MNLILIGYMGSGKTSIGKYLSSILEKEHCDLDDLIIKSEGKTISEIFTYHKENYFREKEREVLEKFLKNHKNYILSLGGGTPCFFDTISLIKNYAKVIYLNVDSFILTKRLVARKKYYPLLAGVNKKEIPNFIQNHLSERKKFYSQAHYKFDISTKTIQEAALEIKNFI